MVQLYTRQQIKRRVDTHRQGGDNILKVVELFAGIGSQTQALKNIGIEHQVVAISEIDKYAYKSYELLHGRVNNLGDITKIERLPRADFWTYSFPCQDLSLAGNGLGCSKGSDTKSSLLWEVERLLTVAKQHNELPKYLLLENVANLISQTNIKDFYAWLSVLELLGYSNYYKILNPTDFGIPQSRRRVFVVSILGETNSFSFPPPKQLNKDITDFLESNVDSKYYISKRMLNTVTKPSEFYSGGDNANFNNKIAYTISTKPDRRLGLSNYIMNDGKQEISIDQFLSDKKMMDNPTRKLTPLECWRLMGWTDNDFKKVRPFISDCQLYKQAGNSIVVQVLEAIFYKMFINTELEEGFQFRLY